MSEGKSVIRIKCVIKLMENGGLVGQFGESTYLSMAPWQLVLNKNQLGFLGPEYLCQIRGSSVKTKQFFNVLDIGSKVAIVYVYAASTERPCGPCPTIWRRPIWICRFEGCTWDCKLRQKYYVGLVVSDDKDTVLLPKSWTFPVGPSRHIPTHLNQTVLNFSKQCSETCDWLTTYSQKLVAVSCESINIARPDSTNLFWVNVNVRFAIISVKWEDGVRFAMRFPNSIP